MDIRELVRALLAGDLLAARQYAADAQRVKVQWDQFAQPVGFARPSSVDMILETARWL